MRSHPVLHTSQSRTQTSTQHSSVHSLAHATRAAGLLAPSFGGGGRGEGDAPSGPLVGGDEPGSSALSPDIHTQWVHSHTCLIAWPIGGGAHWGRRPLWSEDRGNCDMVRLSSQLLFSLLSVVSVISWHFKVSWLFGCPWFSPGRHRLCCYLK